MNNSNNLQGNGLQFQDSVTSNISRSTSDNNANVNNQSKGAIPKVKSTGSRKPTKVNNNVHEIRNGLNHSCKEINGFNKSRRSTGYVEDCERLVNEGVKCEKCRNKSNSSQLHNELLNSDPIEETEYNTPTYGITSYQPTAGSSAQSDLDFQFKLDIDSSESEDNELLSISDDGCIYTYKEDHAADLPSSFFSLDIPPPQSNPPLIQNREDDGSPDMDFLEMDFDPGPSGDGDSDTQSNMDIESSEHLPQNVVIDSIENTCHINQEYSLPLNNACCNPGPTGTNPINRGSPKELSNIPNDNSNQFIPCKKESAISTILEELKKLKMPWACTVAERTTGTSIPRFRIPLHGTNGQIHINNEKMHTSDFQLLKTSDYCDKHKRYISDDLKVVLLWTVEEAVKNQVNQIGASASGATAVLNVLKALSFSTPSIELVQESVKTNLRLNSDVLREYLLSQSVAGSTHMDLINGLEKLTDGQVYARFFRMCPERLLNLNYWLYFWMSHGAVPIATINLENTNIPVSDTWQHQMIFGVTSKGVFLTNPLEYVDSKFLWPQLCSESVLLIDKEEVLSRLTNNVLQQQIELKNKKWDELNVVGQLAHMIRSNNLYPRQRFNVLTHLKIPVEYSAGITLVIKKDSPQYSLLVCCPELPLLESQTTSCSN